jgi:hypothetical protein
MEWWSTTRLTCRPGRVPATRRAPAPAGCALFAARAPAARCAAAVGPPVAGGVCHAAPPQGHAAAACPRPAPLGRLAAQSGARGCLPTAPPDPGGPAVVHGKPPPAAPSTERNADYRCGPAGIAGLPRLRGTGCGCGSAHVHGGLGRGCGAGAGGGRAASGLPQVKGPQTGAPRGVSVGQGGPPRSGRRPLAPPGRGGAAAARLALAAGRARRHQVLPRKRDGGCAWENETMGRRRGARRALRCARPSFRFGRAGRRRVSPAAWVARLRAAVLCARAQAMGAARWWGGQCIGAIRFRGCPSTEWADGIAGQRRGGRADRGERAAGAGLGGSTGSAEGVGGGGWGAGIGGGMGGGGQNVGTAGAAGGGVGRARGGRGRRAGWGGTERAGRGSLQEAWRWRGARGGLYVSGGHNETEAGPQFAAGREGRARQGAQERAGPRVHARRALRWQRRPPRCRAASQQRRGGPQTEGAGRRRKVRAADGRCGRPRAPGAARAGALRRRRCCGRSS